MMNFPTYSPDFKPAPPIGDPFWKGIQVNLDFSIIGAHKAGTTWLYYCLSQHPDLFIPGEQNIFTLYQEKGGKYYNDLYTPAGKHQKLGDFSNSSILDAELPKIFAEKYPNIKLIMMCRHPVKRAFSHYLMDASLGDVNPQQFSFHDALLRPQTYSYYELGLYFKHITRYLEYIERDQLFIFTMDEMRRNPKALIDKICNFLEVSRLDSLSFEQKVNSWQSNQLHIHPAARTMRQLVKILFPQKAHEKLGHYYMKLLSTIAERFVRTSKPTISEDVDTLLKEKYFSENRKLETLIEADLSSWDT